MLHEALVSLFHNEPMLAPLLLEQAFGIQVPDHASAILQDVTLNQIKPTEYCADAVVVLREEHPVQAIVVEIQLGEDNRKIYSWPVYVTALRARLRCPVSLLVVTPYPNIAAWAAQPIQIGPGWTFSALVAGPDVVPTVNSVEEARRNPELAVLSVLAHGKEARAETLAAAALQAVADLDADRAMLYHDLILSALGHAARTRLEELMKTKYEFQSDFAKKYISLGREQGSAEGRHTGVRDVLHRILRRLDVELDSATSERLDAAPVEVLERIAEDAVSARDPRVIVESIRHHLGGTTT